MAKVQHDGNIVDRKCQDYLVPFTNSDKGQQLWGGWNQAGANVFKELLGKVKEARKNEHCEVVEKECLARLRATNKVGVDNQKPKKGKKAAVQVVLDVDDDWEY